MASPQAEARPASGRIETLDALRGVASMAVCWYHFTNGVPDYLPQGLLRASGSFGALGVQVFFVISGFVIPWAMWRAGYRLDQYGRFLAKRILRLDPPYLASIGLVLSLAVLVWARHGFESSAWRVSGLQLLFHLGYLNAFAGYPWLVEVYWTLAIEAQYYLILGLAYPLIVDRRPGPRLAFLAVALAVGATWPRHEWITGHVIPFLLGILTFQFRAGFWRPWAYAALMVGVTLAGLAQADRPVLGLSVGLSLATALVIGFVPIRSRLLSQAGEISYSLYLVHGIVGGSILLAVRRLVDSTPGRIGGIGLALAASVAAACLMYHFVERPSQRWSSRIRYRPAPVETPAPPPAAIEPTGAVT